MSKTTKFGKKTQGIFGVKYKLSLVGVLMRIRSMVSIMNVFIILKIVIKVLQEGKFTI
jgi:hypothetical protein